MKLDHVNIQIKQWMTPYYAKFGSRVSMKQLLIAGNIQRSELPFLRKYINRNGQNDLCYNHVLGECMFHDKCQFRHAPQDDVPNDFAHALCKVIGNPVEYMVNTSPGPPTGGVQAGTRELGQNQGFASPPGKRQRR